MKLSRTQAAETLRVTPKTLYTWERTGKIPAPERDWRGWRWYTDAHLAAIRRHMAGEAADGPESTAPAPPVAEPAAPPLTISARNRLEGKVIAITGDGILCEVVLSLPGGQEIVSVITRSSVERLGLEVGGTAIALIKSTEVMLAR